LALIPLIFDQRVCAGGTPCVRSGFVNITELNLTTLTVGYYEGWIDRPRSLLRRGTDIQGTLDHILPPHSLAMTALCWLYLQAQEHLFLI